MSTTTTRVAVLAYTCTPNPGSIGHSDCHHDEEWCVVEVPTDALGDGDAEATAIMDQINGRTWASQVIVVDDGVPGFPKGCGTWSNTYTDEERQEWQTAHRGCEHTRFDAPPAQGWTQITDPVELEEREATELWTYRTGPYASGEYEAVVGRYITAPNTYLLDVYRDEVGPLVDDAEVGNDLEQAKADAIATITDAIDGL